MDKYQRPEGSLISFFSNKVKKHGGINFAQGIPGFQPPVELLDVLTSMVYKDLHQYAPGIGNHKLLKAIINEYKSISENNLLVVQGATEAISLVYTYLTNKYSEPLKVYSFDPVYESYNNLPEIFNDDFISIDLGSGNEVTEKILSKAIIKDSPGIIFISSPGNPYGKIFNKKEIEIIHQYAHENDLYLIFDAVYKELYFENPPYLPLDILDDKVFYVNSFSKMLSITGWRIGYLISSSEHMKALRSIHDYIGLCAPSILQEAIAEYLMKYDYGKSYTHSLRVRMIKSYDKMKKHLESKGFRIPKTDGGYFIWAELPEGYEDCFKFSIDLYEKAGVATIPGIHFSEKGNKFIRFNIARHEDEIEEGIRRINDFF